jgi:hypothetical protein
MAPLHRFSAIEVEKSLDELFLRTRLQDPESGYEFLGFRERTVGDDGRGLA